MSYLTYGLHNNTKYTYKNNAESKAFEQLWNWTSSFRTISCHVDTGLTMYADDHQIYEIGKEACSEVSQATNSLKGFGSFFYYNYRIYLNDRPGRLLNFWTLKVRAYSRWALIRGWVPIKFLPFSASVVCLFCNKTINANDKTRRSKKVRFL